jgi:hypothetical protein
MNPWSISIDHGVVLIEFNPGTVITPDLLIDIYKALNADPEKYRSTNVVYDMRDIVPTEEASFEKMIGVVKTFQDQREGWWKHEKTALVVNSKIAYGLSRMYATLAEENLDYEVRVFDSDLTAAMAWAQASDQPSD